MLLLYQGCTVFPKIWEPFQIPGLSRVTWSRFHFERPQIGGAIGQDLVARATWLPGFVNPWIRRCVFWTTGCVVARTVNKQIYCNHFCFKWMWNLLMGMDSEIWLWDVQVLLILLHKTLWWLEGGGGMVLSQREYVAWLSDVFVTLCFYLRRWLLRFFWGRFLFSVCYLAFQTKGGTGHYHIYRIHCLLSRKSVSWWYRSLAITELFEIIVSRGDPWLKIILQKYRIGF